MPRRRPRLPDSESFFRGPTEARTVWCDTCGKGWRYGCPECAELFADYHRGAFDDHRVTVRLHRRSDDQDWRRFDVPANVSNLFGRYR